MSGIGQIIRALRANALLEWMRKFLRTHAASLAALWTVTLAILWPIFPVNKMATHLHYGDAIINAYLLNWGQHILVRAPWNYYDTPLFYPQPTSGAFTSSNPLLAFITSPIQIFDNPVLSYNFAMIFAVLLTGLSGYLCGWMLTRNRRASIVAGLIFSCNGDMIWHLAGHTNLVTPFFLPPLILFFLKFTSDGKPRHAILALLCVLGQILCDWYLGFIALFGISVLLGGHLALTKLRSSKRMLALASGLCVVVAIAFALSSPQREVMNRFGNSRGLHDMVIYSADITEYLLPSRYKERNETIAGTIANKLVSWSPRGENTQFFGYFALIAAIMAIGGIVRRGWRRNWRPEDTSLALIALLGMVGLLLSFGPYLWLGDNLTRLPLPFLLIYEHIPPLRFLRATSRFSTMVGISIALLAAVQYARWSFFNHPRRAIRFTLFAILLAVVVIEFRPVTPMASHEVNPAPRRALGVHPEVDGVASYPVDYKLFLIHTTRTFPKSPIGFYGGVGNHYYNQVMARWNRSSFNEYLNDLRALNVSALMIYGAIPYGSADELEIIEKFQGGGLYRILPGQPEQVERARSELAAIPEGPTFPVLPEYPSGEDYFDLSKATPNLRLPMRITYNSIFDPKAFSLPPVDLSEMNYMVIDMAVENLGVDYSESKIYWITVDDPNWNEEKSMTVNAVPDGRARLVVFELGKTKSWSNAAPISALRFDFSASPYPGQEISVRDIRFYRTLPEGPSLLKWKNGRLE